MVWFLQALAYMAPLYIQNHRLRYFFVLTAILCAFAGNAQETDTFRKMRFIYFPSVPHTAWTYALGVSATTMPYEITEELHYRIPALEFQVLRKLGGNFSGYGRLSIQGFQNYVSVGPRLSFPLTKRISASVGDDVAYWFGFNNFEGFKTKATGWQNFPNASVGFRFKKQVLLTVRGEAIMTLDVSSRAGDIKIKSQYQTFSGSAVTVMMEQPFYGRKRMALGFRAAYTSFFWQTWSAFSTYERKFFYPQLIACLTW